MVFGPYVPQLPPPAVHRPPPLLPDSDVHMALPVSPQEEQAGAEDESLWATFPTDETPAHEETAELDVGFESPKSGGAASMPSNPLKPTTVATMR